MCKRSVQCHIRYLHQYLSALTKFCIQSSYWDLLNDSDFTTWGIMLYKGINKFKNISVGIPYFNKLWTNGKMFQTRIVDNKTLLHYIHHTKHVVIGTMNIEHSNIFKEYSVQECVHFIRYATFLTLEKCSQLSNESFKGWKDKCFLFIWFWFDTARLHKCIATKVQISLLFDFMDSAVV